MVRELPDKTVGKMEQTGKHTEEKPGINAELINLEFAGRCNLGDYFIYKQAKKKKIWMMKRTTRGKYTSSGDKCDDGLGKTFA